MRNNASQFSGWLYSHASNKRHLTLIGSVLGLLHVAHVVRRPIDNHHKYQEKIIFVGCVHGGNEDIYQRLELIEQSPPDYLIFTGDLTGSPEMESLKKHFYDEKDQNPDSPFRKYPYFGNWVATFTKEERGKLLLHLSESAEKILHIVVKIRKKGTKILFLEGNWDNPKISGINQIRGEDIHNVFDTKKYFTRHGFSFIDSLTTLETKTSLIVFLPYYILLHFEEIGKDVLEKTKQTCKMAKKVGKTVIMVGHAEANWRIHYLWQKKNEIPNDREKVIANFGRAMALFRPQEVIYPHQHCRIRDEKGKLVDLDAKYILKVDRQKVELIDNPKKMETEDREIIATYIPFGYMAQEEIQLKKIIHTRK